MFKGKNQILLGIAFTFSLDVFLKNSSVINCTCLGNGSLFSSTSFLLIFLEALFHRTNRHPSLPLHLMLASYYGYFELLFLLLSIGFRPRSLSI
jgi:hypothetical protein